MARIKLELWDECMADSIRAIELERRNMKGYYYLAQAQLAQDHPNEASNSAMTAYEICLETNSSSTTSVSALVLQAKKQKWEVKERERLRSRNNLMRELEDGLLKNKKAELQNLKFKMRDYSEESEEKAEIESSTRKKIEDLRSLFAMADPENMQIRVHCSCERRIGQIGLC